MLTIAQQVSEFIPTGTTPANNTEFIKAIDYFIRKQRMESTAVVYKREVRLFFQFVSASDLQTDIRDLALRYWEYLKDNKLQPATISRKLIILQSLFDFLQDNDMVKINPFKIVSKPRVPNIGKTYCPTTEEVLQLLSQPDQTTYRGLRDHTLIYIMSHLGLRVSEARTLSSENLKTQGDGTNSVHVITLKTKGDKERRIRVTAMLYDKLQRLIMFKSDFIHGTTNFFTPTIPSNKPLSSVSIQKMVKEYSQNKEISPHSLRVYFINSVRKMTSDIEIARRLAGHEDIRTTQRYFREANDLSLVPEQIVNIAITNQA